MTVPAPIMRQLAIVRTYDDLHAVLRARADELQITRAGTDHGSGLPAGYASTLLAPEPIKSLGRTSLGPLLSLYGLVLLVMEDPSALQRFAAKRERRKRPLSKTKANRALERATSS